jgi:hypothetical protein
LVLKIGQNIILYYLEFGNGQDLKYADILTSKNFDLVLCTKLIILRNAKWNFGIHDLLNN